MNSKSLLPSLLAGAVGALLALLSPLVISPSRADSQLLPFQGRLTDANGKAVDDGAKVVEFKLYDAPTGGNVKWAGEVHKLSVNGGLVNTLLGSKAGLGGVDFSSGTFLQITVDANNDGEITAADPPLLPRQSVVPAVYAVEAGNSRMLNAHSAAEYESIFDENNPSSGLVNGDKLKPATVALAAIAGNAVDSSRIKDLSIGTVDLAGQVNAATGAETEPGAVTSEKIKDGTIQASDLSSGLRNSVISPGTIVAFGGEVAKIPNGWLLCDGNNLLRSQCIALFNAIGTAWGAPSGDQFNLPDLRGYFLRGVDGGAGRDPDKAGRTAMAPGGVSGNAVGSVQPDEFKRHNHDYDRHTAQGAWGVGGDALLRPAAANTGLTGGNETRPKNAYVNYIIKY